jgi:hypothetical protein
LTIFRKSARIYIGEDKNMEEINESKNLPLHYAMKFIEENNLIDLKEKITQIDQKLTGRKSRSTRKAIITNEFEKLNLLDKFIQKYWPNGKEEYGQAAIKRYKNFFNENIGRKTGDELNRTENDSKFAYEEDLKNFLVKNLEIIEKGLSLYVDENNEKGIEYPVDDKNKRIDLLAIDNKNNPVVIELKVSKGYERVIGQSNYYKNRIKQLFNTKNVRIIIIAREITEELKIATSDLDDFELFEYSLNIQLNKIIK